MPISDDPLEAPLERVVSPWGDRMRGLLMVVVGVAAILALASFRLNEVGWSALYDWQTRGLEPPLETCGNYLSWAGLYGAAFLYLFFGAAAWLLCVLWMRVGVFRMMHPGESARKLWIALGGMMAAACIALSSQELVLAEWAHEQQLLSSGGWLGHLFGYCALKPAIGVGAALAVALTAYLVFLIYFVGTTPLGAARGIARESRAWLARRRERKQNLAARRLHEKEAAWNEAASSESGRQSAQALQSLAGWNEPVQEKEEKPAAPAPQRRAAARARTRGRTGDPLDALLRPIEDAMMSGGAMPISDRKAPPASREKQKSAEQGGEGLRAPARIIDAQNTASRNAVSVPEEAPPFASETKAAEPAEELEETYRLPSLELLHREENAGALTREDELRLQETQQTIISTLLSFGVEVTPGDITRGPTITRYEIYPSKGLRVNKITSLENDIARATKAERINILAPIPGKDTVGIEIANSKKVTVTLHELLNDEAFRSKKKIPVALGKDVYGRTVIGDLAAMPHLLVAGATGSGKSVCINSMITSMLYRFRPDELKLILVDPKVVEMQPYRKLPHLIVPVVTDPRKVIGALRWAVNEMEKRYRMFAEVGVRNFEAFNNRPKPEQDEPAVPEEESAPDYDLADRIARELESQGEDPEPIEDEDMQPELPLDDDGRLPDRIPYVVIIIDELADLMMVVKEDLETYIARITQKARAAGIHLIVATQTPRSDVVTGMIKANIPSRIAFQVSSALDSRIILDSPGAEKLVGKGDLLYLPPGSSKLERAQGAFIDDREVEAVVAHCASQADQDFHEEVQQAVENGGDAENPGAGGLDPEDAELLQKCIEAVIIERKASTSFLQRRLRIGYGRASRMLELMEQRGIVSPADGANRPREVLVE